LAEEDLKEKEADAGSKPETLSSNSAVNEPVILSAEKVTCVFKVKKTIFAPKLQLRAVDKVSLDLHRTEVLALVGESGCGKTTLAKIMLGLEHNDSGDILARIVQPIFQDPYSSLNPRRTIGETILLPLGVHNIGNQSERRQLVEETMGLVGLSQRFFHRYPNQISGGQRQRVAIARALIMKPKILICDEPTSALDVSVQSQILNLLLDLREELGLSFLVITHDFGVVNYIADRIAVMYLGQIVEIGTREQIINTAKHPYTQALLKSVLSLEPGAGIPNINLGGGFPNPLDVPPGCPFHPRCPEAMDVCTSQIPELENTDNTQTRCWLVQKQSL
jgi:peptide/nickel transport system ATP-binding protein